MHGDTRLEHERRWIGDPHALARLELKPFRKLLDDRYLACGRLRLRSMIDTDTGRRVLKLTKKLESDSPRSRPIVTIRLSESEYEALRTLEGFNLRKRRHYFDRGDDTFSVDVFEGDLEGLVTCEIEADSPEALERIASPPEMGVEITEDPFFFGGQLSRVTREELLARLAAVGASG